MAQARRAKARKRPAGAAKPAGERRPDPVTLDDYLASLPGDLLDRLTEVAKARAALDEVERSVWAERSQIGTPSLSVLGGVLGLNRQGAWNRSKRFAG